jgi:nicotinate-nucleotide adenylyltransferase
MNIGLYFGSFNPIHIGHLVIANYMVEFTNLNQIWFVISPQNPLKKRTSLLADYHRYELVERAIGKNDKFRVSDIEFKLPKPSYTIDTLTYLKEKYPKKNLSLIMGEDNLLTLEKWKNYKELIEYYEFYVYPRSGEKSDNRHKIKTLFKKGKIHFVEAPRIEISSSFIRQAIKQGKDVRYYLPEPVYTYIKEMHFYEKWS